MTKNTGKIPQLFRRGIQYKLRLAAAGTPAAAFSQKINAIRLLVAAACFILIALPAYFFILKKRNTKQNAYTYQVYSPAKKALPKEKARNWIASIAIPPGKKVIKRHSLPG